MSALETKIPPPLALLLVGVGMWVIARDSHPLAISEAFRIIAAITFMLFGFAFAGLGIAAFSSAKTTINPVNPEAASSMVTDGIYRYTRNPMYVGLASILIGWALFLAVPLAFMGPILFVLYITRFQIIPEERALRSKFGQSYENYRKNVRRWI
jgi:protein-S-isoprenylcysteine O-methyltransferase Ste14